MSLVSFGSDNHSGVHPLLMEEIVKVNEGFAASYEQDEWSQRLQKKMKDLFRADSSALVFNGTAANVICLQLALKSYEAALVGEISHLALDECGAPEKIAGVKLINLPTKNGKIIISEIENHIVRKGDQHHSQIRLISLTQPTEYGTLYSLDEINHVSDICKKHELYLHIDGARLANAAVALNCNLKTVVDKADLFSFGGAKNGLMLGEFIVVKNPILSEGIKFYRKQSLQLPSKTRFLSAPFLKYLENNLWQKIASHENQMATHLRQGLEGISGLEITQPTQANSVFCILPKSIIKKLRKDFFFYVWDETTFEVRLMTSFSTTKQHVDDFVTKINQLFENEDL